VPRDERRGPAEAARGENRRPASVERRGLADPQRGRPLDERVRELPRVESLAGRQWVLRVLRRDVGALAAQPLERVVQALPDEPLKPLVACRALAAKHLPLPVPPDDAGAEHHRAAGPRSLLVHDRSEAELASADGGDEPRHPRAGDDHFSEKLGLCSTYSILTPSGPVMNAA